MTAGELLAALAYAGVGAGLGSIGAAAITSRSGKGESRAHAADLITNAAGSLADRLDRMNAHLEVENLQMRKAIAALTDVMEGMIPMLPPGPMQTKARAAIKTARAAIV